MIMAKESQNMSYLDHMALLQLERDYSLPFVPPSKLTAFPGQSGSNLPGLNTGQENAVGRFLKTVPPNCNISYHPENPYPKDSQNPLIYNVQVEDEPIDAFCAPQKRFLIFDQSGNQTRLFFSPSFSTENQIFASNTPSSANVPFGEKLLMKPIIEEKWEENHLSDGEGDNDMLEDSQEIDALFDSDSDDDDEVTSTGHSRFTIEESYNKEDKLLEEPIEVPKRQKLLDGKYKKSSGAILRIYEDDVESSCAGDLNKRENKVKIHRALKILESIIPGLNSKDPLSIINKAIVYLKSMKIEAEALGISYPGDKSVISPNCLFVVDEAIGRN